MNLVSSADFFLSKFTFFFKKKSLRNTELNGLHPDQNRRYVGAALTKVAVHKEINWSK